MSRARLGTLYAGAFGVFLLVAVGLTAFFLLPAVWPTSAADLALADNYLAFVDENSLFFRLIHLAQGIALAAATFLIFHLRPDAEAEAAGAEEQPLPWLVLLGMAGTLLLAAVALFDAFSLPALARIAASGSQTAVADWEGQMALWSRWLPAAGWVAFSIWYLWRKRQDEGWLGQLARLVGRYGLLLGVFVAALPLSRRQTGREFAIEALFWLLLAIWALARASQFWRQELAAFYSLEDDDR